MTVQAITVMVLNEGGESGGSSKDGQIQNIFWTQDWQHLPVDWCVWEAERSNDDASVLGRPSK